ncbi:MAG: hypothetical protein NT045_03460 [Candidatus Aureabacteria bacterium]|nr:hypothetical protein [Candidatus Auribacterota bacterium]
MKKLIPLVVIAALLVAGYFLVARRPAPLPCAGMLPAGAIGYIGLNNGRTIVADITASGVWKGLAGVESLNGLIREPVRKAVAAGVPSSLVTLGELLGSEAAAAAYDEKSRFGNSGIAVVRSTAAAERLKSLATRTYLASPAGSFAGRDLYTCRIPALSGWEAACAFGPGDAVMAIARSGAMELVRASLDLAEKKGGVSLSGDRSFVAGMGMQLRGAGGLAGAVYLEGLAVRQALAKLTAVAAAMKDTASPASAVLARFQPPRIPVSSWSGYLYRGDGFALSVRTRTDPAAATMVNLFNGKPGRIRALGMVPEGTVFLSARRLGDLGAVWDAYAAQPEVQPAMRLIQRFEKACGVNVRRDVLPWLGDEGAILLSDVQLGGLFPIVKAQLILATRDPAAAGRTALSVMERYARRSAASGQSEAWAFLRPQLKEDAYRGTAIHTLTFPIPGLAPSYALIDNHLVIGSDAASVQAIIDAGKGNKKPLSADPTFAALDAPLPRALTHLSYLDTGRALALGEGVGKWLLSLKKITIPTEDTDRLGRFRRYETELPRVVAALKPVRGAIAAGSSKGDLTDQILIVRIKER